MRLLRDFNTKVVYYIRSIKNNTLKPIKMEAVIKRKETKTIFYDQDYDCAKIKVDHELDQAGELKIVAKNFTGEKVTVYLHKSQIDTLINLLKDAKDNG